jgi:hypothetical protein
VRVPRLSASTNMPPRWGGEDKFFTTSSVVGI